MILTTSITTTTTVTTKENGRIQPGTVKTHSCTSPVHSVETARDCGKSFLQDLSCTALKDVEKHNFWTNNGYVISSHGERPLQLNSRVTSGSIDLCHCRCRCHRCYCRCRCFYGCFYHVLFHLIYVGSKNWIIPLALRSLIRKSVTLAMTS